MIHTLYSDDIYITKLPQHKQIKELLMPFALRDDLFIETEWNCDVQTTMSEKNPELPWSRVVPFFIEQMKEYIKWFEPKKAFEIRAAPWMCRYKKGAFQEQHNHLGIFNEQFSCAYFMNNPPNSSKFIFSNSQDYYTAAGWRNFFDKPPERLYEPSQEEGTLIIFPSHLDHYVTPNQSDETRVSISMNFALV